LVHFANLQTNSRIGRKKLGSNIEFRAHDCYKIKWKKGDQMDCSGDVKLATKIV
jgi:hypothetical protein